MNSLTAINDTRVTRVGHFVATGRNALTARTTMTKVLMGLVCGLSVLLSIQYLSDSSSFSIIQEPVSETKYIHALGYNYQPQPKDKPHWIPKLISNGKSNWTTSELDSFSDESRKVLMSNKDVAPQILDPDSDSILILTPMKNSAKYITKYFELVERLEYPRDKISLAFLVSDSTDDTQQMLIKMQNKYQEDGPKEMQFKRFDIFQQDFFYALPHDQRHSLNKQRERRIVMARARNYLWTRALGDEQWVVWIDGDLTYYPPTIIRDLMAYDKDVIVPNCMLPNQNGNPPYRVYDFNAWQETPESLAMIEKLKDDVFLAEGYDEIKTYRKHLDDFGENDIVVPLDGVGGTFTLVKAHVHRSGVGFPTWLFQHQVETEGFAKLAIANGFGVYGLPHYNVHHTG